MKNEKDAIISQYMTMVGASRAGKSTFATCCFENFYRVLPRSNSALGFVLSEDGTQQRMAVNRAKLDAAIRRDSFVYEGGITGTQELEVYSFHVSYDGKPCIIYNIMDLPGGLLHTRKKERLGMADPSGGDDQNMLQDFQAHLAKSSVLIAPFNSALVAEARLPHEIKRMRELTDYAEVCDTIFEWAAYRQKIDGPATLLLVPVRCENYLSLAPSPEAADLLYQRTMAQFGDVIARCVQLVPFCHVRYAPLESLGCVRRTNYTWQKTDEEGREIGPVAVYQSESPHRRIVSGVEASTSVLLQHGMMEFERHLRESMAVDTVMYKEKAKGYKKDAEAPVGQLMNALLPWRRRALKKLEEIESGYEARIRALRAVMAELAQKAKTPFVKDIHGVL